LPPGRRLNEKKNGNEIFKGKRANQVSRLTQFRQSMKKRETRGMGDGKDGHGSARKENAVQREETTNKRVERNADQRKGKIFLLTFEPRSGS